MQQSQDGRTDTTFGRRIQTATVDVTVDVDVATGTGNASVSVVRITIGRRGGLPFQYFTQITRCHIAFIFVIMFRLFQQGVDVTTATRGAAHDAYCQYEDDAVMR
jgi:hypothetical protein